MASKVKICGITNIDDALAAVDAGADAVGMVFYQDSKRFIEPREAKKIIAAVGPFVTTVGLFVNERIEVVERVHQALGLHLIQLHGDEDSSYCEQLTMPYIKAIRMAEDIDPQRAMCEFPGATAFLFDAWQEDQYGGTGTSFDWHRIGDGYERPVILAGGLTVDNIVEAVILTRPYAVDVSGGVESSPGRKDHLLMNRFIQLAKSVQC